MIIDLEHFKARLLQDALTQATAQYWDRRAQQFEAATPQLEEYRGTATPSELNEAWQRCQDTALACRSHAALLRSEPEPISEEVREVLT